MVSLPHLFILVSFLRLLLLCSAADILMLGDSISINETLVSAAGAFAFGFFSPTNSSRFVGIWYNNIGEKTPTVVWVANRDNPLTDSSGVVKITADRNIAILDGKGTVLWSSNVPNDTGTAAVLLDSGNLVLRRRDGSDVWQSFDQPTNTILPNMNLRSNIKTGFSQRLWSWRAADDPSTGNFSFGIDPSTSLQIITWQGSTPYWRSHVWNGKSLSGARETNTNSQYVLKVTMNDQEISVTFSPTGTSAPARYVLDESGRLMMLSWMATTKNWTMLWSRPSKFCDAYDRCGPSGICDSSGNPPMCKCLQGFVPRSQKDWDSEHYSGGCVRRIPVKCDKGDKFLKSERMKLPDRLTLIRNVTAQQCDDECLFSCQCTAYSFANVSSGGSSSRCLIWVRELMDVEQVANGGDDLNIRLVASELVTSAPVDGSPNKQKHLPAILLPTISAGVLLLGTFCYFLIKRLRRQWKRKRSEAVLFREMNVSGTLGRGEDISELPLVDFSSISAATNNFSSANKLGEGGFGPVYKGTLSKGLEITVKRLSKTSGQGFEEFKNEVELIARLQHTNLVRLLGWCTHENEKLLVYEYLPNKSLDKFLFDPSLSAELNWSQRYHIIEGIAQGLLYLHRYSRVRVIHRDLKASNILLDGVMNPKISDFGLARIFGGNQTEANTNRVVGTYGYMSPEYALDGLFSDKSDVFSFGVIVLEIITGKRSTGFYPYKDSLNLLGYAWQLWEEGRSLELVDSAISSSILASEVVKCVQVGLLCIQENAVDRPPISSVISMLGNDNATLPRPKQPAFAVGRPPNAGNVNSSSSASKESLNDLTISVVEGR